MTKKKSVVDGRWTIDVVDSTCRCGEKVRYLRKGYAKLLPNGHKCKYQDLQRDVIRTIRAEEAANINVTPSEAERRINEVLYD